jgi:hypothetical protein
VLNITSNISWFYHPNYEGMQFILYFFFYINI